MQNEKHHEQKTEFKARLMVRGFLEVDKPQSDSPMLEIGSLKLLMALAAKKF